MFENKFYPKPAMVAEWAQASAMFKHSWLRRSQARTPLEAILQTNIYCNTILGLWETTSYKVVTRTCNGYLVLNAKLKRLQTNLLAK